MRPVRSTRAARLVYRSTEPGFSLDLLDTAAHPQLMPGSTAVVTRHWLETLQIAVLHALVTVGILALADRAIWFRVSACSSPHERRGLQSESLHSVVLKY